ncbi:MAG: diguanylate cyclase domain-containing protein [Candidatus Brachytrichaceae bacterium NZ_4S206]|jgi:diguanylate cyclase (GGDEF)-like protein
MNRSNQVRILFVAANPRATPRIELDEEIRAITKKIRESRYPESLELISLWAARADDLLQGLNEYRPNIVHFSGHGTRDGSIIFVGQDKKPNPVKPEALKALFEAVKDNVRVVVLNACYTYHQALAISEVIDCVIGTQNAIQDSLAIAFAASFYRALGYGRSVQDAFKQGRAAVLLEGGSESDVPILLTRPGAFPSWLHLYSLNVSEIEHSFVLTIGPILRKHKERKDYQVTLVHMDLDKFESINNRFGVKIGNEIIGIVSKLFQQGFEPYSYYVSRWSDDAFWACLRGEDKVGIGLAHQIKQQIQEYPWDIIAPGLYVTASFGVAQLCETDTTPEKWMIRALLGTREAKMKGGNRVSLGPCLLPRNMEDLRDFYRFILDEFTS